MDVIPSSEMASDRKSVNKQLHGTMQRAIAALSEEQREVFLIREFGERTGMAARAGQPRRTGLVSPSCAPEHPILALHDQGCAWRSASMVIATLCANVTETAPRVEMFKKNGASSPREGTASAVREAARSGDPETATSPERPKRWNFTAEYKLRIIREADESIASGGEDSYSRRSREPAGSG
jgi:hypothetical protein